MKKILAIVLAFAMVLGGIYWVDNAGEEVKAATVANADMLNVKVQVATDDSNVIRFVTSVDSLDYSNVGFEVTPEGGATKTYTTTKVYERIASTEEAVEYTFSPKVVDTSSEYFVTAKLRAEAGVDYTVKAFATQKNGEKIYGATRCVAVEDGKSTTTLNLTYEATTAPTKGSTIDVTYGKDNQATTAEVLAVDGKNVSVRVTVNPSTLPSATKFTFGTTGSAIYRNLYTKYTGEGTEDTTWYDVYLAADSKETEFTIATNADMYGFMTMYAGKNLFKNKTLYVIRDIAMNDNVTKATVESWANGTEAPYKWHPSGDDVGGTRFQGTFDGQMHTLSGFYVKEDNSNYANNKYAGTYVGMFGSTDGESVIKNFYLTDSYMTTTGGRLSTTATTGTMYAYLGSVAGENRGTIENVYSNAILETSGQRTGGIVGVHNTTTAVATAGKQAIVDSCWFDGEVRLLESTGLVGGGIIGAVMQRESTISNVLFTGKVTAEATGAASIGGIIGMEVNSCTINMIDCISVGTVTAGSGATGVGAAVGKVNQSGSVHKMYNVYADSAMGSLVGAGTADYPGLAVAKSTLYGVDLYKNTLIDVDDEWYARTSDTPVLRVFDEKYDASTVVKDFGDAKRNNWYNANMKAYVVSSLEALESFRDYTKTYNFSGKMVALGADIDLNPGWTAPKSGSEAVKGNPKTWTPISPDGAKYAGIFDGRNHEVRGMYINATSIYQGFFGMADNANATIKNLSLVNSYVKYTGGSVFIGGVVGYIYGKLENVYSDAVVVSDGAEFGGIAGRAEGTISNCWFAGEVYSTKTTAGYMKQGGVVGTVWSQTGSGKAKRPVTIQNCLNTGKIVHNIAPNASGTVAGVGGILGGDRGYSEVTIKNCVDAGEIITKQTNGVGSVVGCINMSTSGLGYSKGTIENCYGKTIVGTVNASAAVTQTENVTIEPTALVGSAVYNNANVALDYTVWIARKNDVVVPTVFVNWIVPASETVAK